RDADQKIFHYGASLLGADDRGSLGACQQPKMVNFATLHPRSTIPPQEEIMAAKAAKKKYSDILFEVKDQVAWVTINRPRVLNAFREQTLDQLIDALQSTRLDPSIVCAVVTGAGDKSFSAGGDFFAMKRLN